MGVFARPGGVDVSAIQKAMMPALAQWFSAHLQIFDPESGNAGVFDAKTNTRTGGTAPTIVWDSGVNGALVQPIRAASDVSFGDQAIGLQGVRFQSEIPVPVLRSGLQLRVLDGGNDPSLQAFTYGLLSAVDSSIAWGRIYEARLVAS